MDPKPTKWAAAMKAAARFTGLRRSKPDPGFRLRLHPGLYSLVFTHIFHQWVARLDPVNGASRARLFANLGRHRFCDLGTRPSGQPVAKTPAPTGRLAAIGNIGAQSPASLVPPCDVRASLVAVGSFHAVPIAARL